MAHIKVERRSMRPEEWTDLRFCWLKRYVYSEKWEIQNLMIQDARQVAEMEFQFYPGEPRPLKRGDMYFTPDGTAFMTADVQVPKHLQGQELWFSLKTAARSTAAMLAVWIPTGSVCCCRPMRIRRRPCILK